MQDAPRAAETSTASSCTGDDAAKKEASRMFADMARDIADQFADRALKVIFNKPGVGADRWRMSDTIDIERYLAKRDPDLGRAIGVVRASKGGPLRPPPSKDNAFQALVRAVIYQRTSESSGATVYAHLEKIAKGELKPAKVLSLTEPRIQMAGMSASKAGYVLNVARWFEANPATAKKLRSMPDERIIEALTTIQGIGLWSVNVLLVFNFGRLDVAPAPDAVIRGVASIIYGLRSLPSVEFVEKKIETWRPYRSIATMYLYHTGKLKLTKADIRRGRPAIDEAGLRSGT